MHAATAHSPALGRIIPVITEFDERLIEHAKKTVGTPFGKISKEIFARLIKASDIPGWESLYDKVLNGPQQSYKCDSTDAEDNHTNEIRDLLTRIEEVKETKGSRVPETSVS